MMEITKNNLESESVVQVVQLVNLVSCGKQEFVVQP